MFPPGGRLTLGVIFAIEAYQGAVPTMRGQTELARRVEEIGFAALWFRDVPLHEPRFGDVGQIFDPWVYLGHIASATSDIALATGGIILPLHHPIDVAKAAASVDVLSGGRMVLGLCTGDRPLEYPAYGVAFSERAERFRHGVEFLRALFDDSFPQVRSPLGTLTGVDLVPKPFAGQLPLLAIGQCEQSIEWLAAHFDGYVTYPRSLSAQAGAADSWHEAVEAAAPGVDKPFAQSLYIDLVDAPGALSTPIHLGYRLGRHALVGYLEVLYEAGVRHVVFNLKYGSRPAAEVVDEIGEYVLPAIVFY